MERDPVGPRRPSGVMVAGRNVGSWFSWQALAKPVPGSFAAQWCPELASESLVYPAVTAMMMGWKSACGVLQHAHRRLCFAQPPLGAGLPTDSEIRRDQALPKTASGQLGPLVTISTSMECPWLSSLPFTSKPWKGPCRPRWPPCRRFGVSGECHHKKKKGCPPRRKL